MEYLVTCHQGCGEEFAVHAPDRFSPELIEGIPAQCTNCGEKYTFTVDGDGEPDLDSSKGDENITGPDSERSTHY